MNTLAFITAIIGFPLFVFGFFSVMPNHYTGKKDIRGELCLGIGIILIIIFLISSCCTIDIQLSPLKLIVKDPYWYHHLF
ncbi:MAG: hypothetical protein PHE24_01730 [Patescibacteria group bacterium]|nr:hypothetical protein [Patescibacteria group bacterium]